jgi:hypothetical protein
MSGMKALSWARELPLRAQLALIGSGYAAVLAYGVMEEYMRYLAELRNPVEASGGMWAFGDEVLAWSIFCLFMVPTSFLALLLRQHERSYDVYSKILFWASLSAPLCLGVLVLGQFLHFGDVVDPLVWRTWRGPFVLIVIGMSRLLAQIDAAKRLLTRALLIESGTFAIFFALLVFGK